MLKPPGELHHYLLRWFEREKRAMPWRETRDPYAIWVSETMLQQTQVETVKPYYHRFLEAFPTVADLAKAELQRVLSLWAGLGYYRRARHLHLAAERMVELHDGRVPETMEELLSLPGIGRYTAGAVGSIAFGLAVPVVDGNVMRVISRLTGFDGDISEVRNAAFFWKVAEEIVLGAEPGISLPHPPLTAPLNASKKAKRGRKLSLRTVRFGEVNQAMMELGATVCLPSPRVPACAVCPVREFCVAFAEGRQGELPVKKKRGGVRVVRGVAVVVTRSQESEDRSQKGRREVLLMQRPGGVVWEEMWEMPVVASFEFLVSSFEKGEDDELKLETRNLKLLAEWVREVLGVRVGKMVRCGEVVHGLTHRRMEYLVVRGEVEGSGQWPVVGGQRGRTQNAKRKTQNAKRGEGSARDTKLEMLNVGDGDLRFETGDLKGGGGEVILPMGVGMGGKRYVGWRWVKWPLEGRGELPMARVVFKVAERAEGESGGEFLSGRMCGGTEVF